MQRTFLTTSASRPVRERPLKRLPQIICGFFILAYFLFFLYRTGVALFYPYGLNYGEGAVFYEAGQLWRNNFNPNSLYPANDIPPYQAGIYSPGFYYLQAFLMFLFGPQSILGGRLISVGACFYLGFSVYRIARSQELSTGRPASYTIGLAAALTPFATAAIYKWGMLAKADLLAIALGFGAVQAIWFAENDRRLSTNMRPFLLAGFLCALALLTKQSMLAAPGAIFIWLAWNRRWRDLGLFFGGLVPFLAVVTILLQVSTGGQFLKHIITYNSQAYDFGFLWAGLRYFVGGHFVLLALAFIWIIRPFTERYERVDVWRIYFLTALVVSFSVGKVGADFNYYTESLFLVALLAWWEVGRLQLKRPEMRFGDFRLSLTLVALLFLVYQYFDLHHFPTVADGADTPSFAQFEQSRQVAELVRDLQTRGPLLAEDSGWQAVAGLPTDLDDPFVFGQLAGDKLWDDRLFLERLDNGYYKSVMFEIAQPDMSEAALEEAVKNNSAAPFPRNLSPVVLQIIQNRDKFQVEKRIGRWLFLTAKS